MISNSFEIVSDINELSEKKYGTVFINNEKINYDLLCENLTDKKIDILCLPSQPSLEQLQDIQKSVDKIFINLEQINNIKNTVAKLFNLIKFI